MGGYSERTCCNHSDARIVSFSTLYPETPSVAAPRPGKGSAAAGTLAVAINVKQDYLGFGNKLAQNTAALWEKFEGTEGTHMAAAAVVATAAAAAALHR